MNRNAAAAYKSYLVEIGTGNHPPGFREATGKAVGRRCPGPGYGDRVFQESHQNRRFG